jgi:ADP-heptose:LPS heptosyltransferase
VERYGDVFAQAGFPVIPSKDICIIPSKEASMEAVSLIGTDSGLNIGVAPYAKHELKMWPEENMISLLRLIAEKHRCKFWLFGGNEDAGKMAAFQSRVPGSVNLVGKLGLEDELALMSKLDIMIAMDSSNMHMAALAGTRTISIWGGTDPIIGFSAWMQPDNFSIRIPVDELTCRPCTIYGKGVSKRSDFACMTRLTPDIVYKKIDKILLPDNPD